MLRAWRARFKWRIRGLRKFREELNSFLGGRGWIGLYRKMMMMTMGGDLK